MFTRHEFLVVTVKEWLKSVYFYQSYRKNKSGVPLILDHPVGQRDCGWRALTPLMCYVTANNSERCRHLPNVIKTLARLLDFSRPDTHPLSNFTTFDI